MRKNTYWNFFSSVLPMLLGVVTVPFLIKRIGVEQFGILSIVWTLIGYFSIFDFGIGRALTQQVSHLKNDENILIPTVKTGLLLMAFAGLFGGTLLYAVSSLFGVSWLNVTPNIEKATLSAILISAFGIPFTTITSGLKGILEGYEDFKVSSILKMILGVLNFLAPVLVVLLIGNSLPAIVLSLVCGRALIMVLHIFPILKRISLTKFYEAKKADKDQTKSTLLFGAWMTLSNLVSPLMVNADRFVISSVLGASIVAFYTVPFDIIVRLLVIPASLTTTLFPRFASLFHTDRLELNRLYEKSVQYILAVMGIVSVGIMVCSYFGLSLWISRDFAEKSWYIACILAVGLVFNSLAQVPYALVQARGAVKVTSILHVCEFLIYVPLLYISLKLFGLVGAAYAWTIRVALDYFALTYFAKSKLKLANEI